MKVFWSGDWDGWVDTYGILSPAGTPYPSYGSIPHAYWSAELYYDTSLGRTMNGSEGGIEKSTLESFGTSPFIGAIVNVSAYNEFYQSDGNGHWSTISGATSYAFNGIDFSLTRYENGDVRMNAGRPGTTINLLYRRYGGGEFDIGQTSPYFGPYDFGTYGGDIPNTTGWAHIHSVTFSEATTVPEAITSLAPVPEPSTWSMLITGFCGLGLALRRVRARRVRLTSNLSGRHVEMAAA
jgi:hypothetical protein